MKFLLSSIAANVIEPLVECLDLKASKKKIAFIPTAGNVYDNPHWITKDRDALLGTGAILDDIDISAVTSSSLKARLDTAEIIFVAGGNTFYLLQHAFSSGFLDYLCSKEQSNKAYVGSSAGALIIGPSIECIKHLDDEPAAAAQKSAKSIGLIPFIPLVHYGAHNEAEGYSKVMNDLYSSSYPFLPLWDSSLVECENKNFKYIVV
jgi:dipeptidase E